MGLVQIVDCSSIHAFLTANAGWNAHEEQAAMLSLTIPAGGQ